MFQSGQTLSATDVDRMQSALEAAGVIFIEENGEGAGVRLRKERSTAGAVELIKALNDEHAQLGLKPSPRKALNRMRAAIVEDKQKKR